MVYVKFKNHERKKKSLFIIYADFESNLVPENNGNQNPEETYTRKYQKHVSGSYGHMLGCVEEKWNKPFKCYLGRDAIYNFVISIRVGSRNSEKGGRFAQSRSPWLAIKENFRFQMV